MKPDVQRIAAGACGFFAALFAVTAVSAGWQREFSIATMGVILATLLGYAAYSLFQQPTPEVEAPPPARQPHTLLVASSHQAARYWCLSVAVPPRNVAARDITVATPDNVGRIRGLTLKAGFDSVVWVDEDNEAWTPEKRHTVMVQLQVVFR